MTTTWTTEVKGTGAYAEVNGLNLYYETHGAGRPMILLHGGLGSGLEQRPESSIAAMSLIGQASWHAEPMEALLAETHDLRPLSGA